MAALILPLHKIMIKGFGCFGNQLTLASDNKIITPLIEKNLNDLKVNNHYSHQKEDK